MAPNEKAAWWRPQFKPKDPNEFSSWDDVKWSSAILFAIGTPLWLLLLVLFAVF